MTPPLPVVLVVVVVTPLVIVLVGTVTLLGIEVVDVVGMMTGIGMKIIANVVADAGALTPERFPATSYAATV